VVTEIGKRLKLIRINTGDSLRTMSEKLGISAAYLSSIENGKRNIPDGFDDLIFKAYLLSEEDMKKIKDAIFSSKENYKVDLSAIDDKKRSVLLSITEGKLDAETVDRLCEVINENENKKKNEKF
jgi:transcriptional regulator with XRE-family HTH domain